MDGNTVEFFFYFAKRQYGILVWEFIRKWREWTYCLYRSFVSSITKSSIVQWFTITTYSHWFKPISLFLIAFTINQRYHIADNYAQLVVYTIPNTLNHTPALIIIFSSIKFLPQSLEIIYNIIIKHFVSLNDEIILR